ncbi:MULTISPECIES: STAS domain-containing protein [Pseudonocardiaceae]|uniref:Anti-sigma factor antagonist n=2 Tax=Amycolatopsis TaxID=1813 RepID=A0A8E2B915_9PSEU|nr:MULTISPECIES: STAS domain-containing protein [Pseudonocardiaceae]MBB2506444.1 STAS domain-containing protein [Amycolatopsis echigonensis]MCF6426137.1 STAS domain-containing protein [Amycolatopsis tucumanensis]
MTPPSEQPPPVELSIRSHREADDGTLVIEVTGEVDLDTAPHLAAAIIECLDREASRGPCILDLTAVTFLDSAGLTVLLQATRHAGRRHASLPVVVDANRPVIRPIEVTGLDDVLALYHTVDEALQAPRP